MLHPILSSLEDPTLCFRLIFLFERDHRGKVPDTAVWIHSDPSLVSPSGVQAPHLFEAFELLLVEPQMQGCSLTRPYAAWTTRLSRADSYTSLEHWLQKLLFLFETKQTNEKILYIFLVFYLLTLFFLWDWSKAFYRDILVPNMCRRWMSLVCRLKCQFRAISIDSWSLLLYFIAR